MYMYVQVRYRIVILMFALQWRSFIVTMYMYIVHVHTRTMHKKINIE